MRERAGASLEWYSLDSRTVDCVWLWLIQVCWIQALCALARVHLTPYFLGLPEVSEETM